MKKLPRRVGEVERRVFPSLFDMQANRGKILVIHAGVHGEDERLRRGKFRQGRRTVCQLRSARLRTRS